MKKIIDLLKTKKNIIIGAATGLFVFILAIAVTANPIKNEIQEELNDSKLANTQTSSVTNTTANGITLDEAKEIALSNANLTSDQVTFTKAKNDYEDGISIYEIEFIFEQTEYEYEINANDGTIIKTTQDYYYTNSSNTNSSSTSIDESQAKSIAINHAGVSESEVTFTKIHSDYDNGNLVYEIEFVINQTEYDYEINATNGQIIDFDIDYYD